MTRQPAAPAMTPSPAESSMADLASAHSVAQAVAGLEKLPAPSTATHNPTRNTASLPARISVTDHPGEQATLTLVAGDLELSIALAPAECIAVAGPPQNGAARVAAPCRCRPRYGRHRV